MSGTLSSGQQEGATDPEDDAGMTQAEPSRPQQQPAAANRGSNKQWDAFVSGSKMREVSDVWDLKAAAGKRLGPQASRKQLEEMTSRFRHAKGEHASWRMDIGAG